MKIALGSDHRGRDATDALMKHLESRGDDAQPVGRCDQDSCDYPDNAFIVAQAVSTGEAQFGILVCGSGNGVAMAANKVHGIRAALCCDIESATMTRKHNNANVLCLSGDRLSNEEVCAIADAFVDTAFEGGRHARRVEKIMAIEGKSQKVKRSRSQRC